MPVINSGHFKDLNLYKPRRFESSKLVFTGCVPQGKPDADYVRGLSVIGVQQIDRVVEVVEETLKGNQV